MTGQVVGKGTRFGQTFGVGPVGAEQQLAEPHDLLDGGEVVLVVRGDPYVPAEGFDRVGREAHRHLAVDLLQLLDQG